MKKTIYSVLGAIIAGVICNILFWGVGRISVALDIRLYNSEDEASRNFLIFLVFFGIFILVGSVYGYYLARKSDKSKT